MDLFADMTHDPMCQNNNENVVVLTEQPRETTAAMGIRTNG